MKHSFMHYFLLSILISCVISVPKYCPSKKIQALICDKNSYQSFDGTCKY